MDKSRKFKAENVHLYFRWPQNEESLGRRHPTEKANGKLIMIVACGGIRWSKA